VIIAWGNPVASRSPHTGEISVHSAEAGGIFRPSFWRWCPMHRAPYTRSRLLFTLGYRTLVSRTDGWWPETWPAQCLAETSRNLWIVRWSPYIIAPAPVIGADLDERFSPIASITHRNAERCDCSSLCRPRIMLSHQFSSRARVRARERCSRRDYLRRVEMDTCRIVHGGYCP